MVLILVMAMVVIMIMMRIDDNDGDDDDDDENYNSMKCTRCAANTKVTISNKEIKDYLERWCITILSLYIVTSNCRLCDHPKLRWCPGLPICG